MTRPMCKMLYILNGFLVTTIEISMVTTPTSQITSFGMADPKVAFLLLSSLNKEVLNETMPLSK